MSTAHDTKDFCGLNAAFLPGSELEKAWLIDK